MTQLVVLQVGYKKHETLYHWQKFASWLSRSSLESLDFLPFLAGILALHYRLVAHHTNVYLSLIWNPLPKKEHGPLSESVYGSSGNNTFEKGYRGTFKNFWDDARGTGIWKKEPGVDFGCKLSWKIDLRKFQSGRMKFERDVQGFVFQARVTIYVLYTSI